MSELNGTKLIIGCGYLGMRVARQWRASGLHVMAVTRSADRAIELGMEGLFTIGGDVTNPPTLTCLKNLPKLGDQHVDCVLFAVGYDRTSGKSIDEVYVDGLRNVLDALPDDVQRFIYISTTGVYGPAGGEWVNEETPTDPQRDGGRASLAAEKALIEHPIGARSVILRLAGIYGPGRVPFLKELSAGEPIQVSSIGYLNLIHVDDAATVVLAADEFKRTTSTPPNGTPQIFCVSDGHPVTRHEFYSEAARIMDAPPPRFVEPDATSSRAARARGNRRVRNDKMLAEFDVPLAYPDYRAGLAAVLETENQ